VLSKAGAPFDATRELLILLKNIVNAPKTERFRTVWMAKLHTNRQKQGMALDGMKLLGSVGFQLFDQGVEVVGVMDEPSQEELEIIKHTITLLEPNILVKPKSPRIPLSTSLSWPKHIDRQVNNLTTMNISSGHLIMYKHLIYYSLGTVTLALASCE
jgi:hypothetical protein